MPSQQPRSSMAVRYSRLSVSPLWPRITREAGTPQEASRSRIAPPAAVEGSWWQNRGRPVSFATRPVAWSTFCSRGVRPPRPTPALSMPGLLPVPEMPSAQSPISRS
ncbi:Uncharacterised protein [Flavonifractor plautii]|uniref:Uncharacterized protein n=1 Tax=Flavonifractor plautii TaxID=292800 RepID=A0A174T982_FLAPL|nr:Uncharacterised protein [Flavonifractor plautii]